MYVQYPCFSHLYEYQTTPIFFSHRHDQVSSSTSSASSFFTKLCGKPEDSSAFNIFLRTHITVISRLIYKWYRHMSSSTSLQEIAIVPATQDFPAWHRICKSFQDYVPATYVRRMSGKVVFLIGVILSASSSHDLLYDI